MSQIIIDGRNYLPTDGRIAKDHFNGDYILKDHSITVDTSIVLRPGDGFDGSLNTVFIHANKVGSYLDQGFIKILVTRHGNIYIINNVTIKGSGKIYQSVDEDTPNVYYDEPTNIRFNINNKFRAFNNQVKTFNDVNNKNIPDIDKAALIQRNYDFGVDSFGYKLFEGLDYTFGVELETSSGRLTEKDVEGLNLKCEFDGSLRETPDQRKEDVLGGEYITGVLKGDSGMYQLQKVCNKLAEKCKINSKCGVHVHVGGIKFTKENIVYMYILGEMLQNEIYEMLPTSRRKNTYCRKLKSLSLDLRILSSSNTSIGYKILIDEYYNKIFKEVSHGKAQPDKQSNSRTNHPLGSKCGYNKDTQRYCWLNFVTAMFNTKNNPEAITLEFRSHSATLNYTKVKNWIKICMAFCSFVENHKSSIKRGYWLDKDKVEFSINLSTIVRAVYPKTYKLLVTYIENRKEKFFTDDGKIEQEEYDTDKEGIKALTLKEDILCV